MTNTTGKLRVFSDGAGIYREDNGEKVGYSYEGCGGWRVARVDAERGIYTQDDYNRLYNGDNWSANWDDEAEYWNNFVTKWAKEKEGAKEHAEEQFNWSFIR